MRGGVKKSQFEFGYLIVSLINGECLIQIYLHPDYTIRYACMCHGSLILVQLTIDAMQISWADKYVYIFPLFSMLLWPVLTKFEKDRLHRAIIMIPKWPTQSGVPRIMKKSISFKHIKSTEIRLPGTQAKHPMAPKLKLVALICYWEDRNMYY